MLSLRQLVLRRTGTNDQFRAAFFVVSPLSLRPVRFQLDLIQPLTVFAQLCFDRVSALRALTVLGFELLYVVSLRAHLFRHCIDLRVISALSRSNCANLLASTTRSLARISSRSLA